MVVIKMTFIKKIEGQCEPVNAVGVEFHRNQPGAKYFLALI